jgi:menaquinone-dependent protoporphyrinogen IX oxidase
MPTRVLVAYGTKYGATAEIAAKIGETLRQAGLQADVVPANIFKPKSLSLSLFQRETIGFS